MISAVIAGILLLLCLRFVGGFISPNSGDAPGNVGHLFVAAVYLIMAGPFVVLTVVLGLPLISKNPKFRGADR